MATRPAIAGDYAAAHSTWGCRPVDGTGTIARRRRKDATQVNGFVASSHMKKPSVPRADGADEGQGAEPSLILRLLIETEDPIMWAFVLRALNMRRRSCLSDT